MEFNFDKVKAFSVTTILYFICGVFIPGFLFLYVFKKDIFLSLDLFRLTALATSITVPLFFVNGFLILIGLTIDHKEVPDEDLFHKVILSSIYFGSLITIPVIYFSILIGYFFKFTVRQEILTVIINEIILLIVLIIVIYSDYLKTKKKTHANK